MHFRGLVTAVGKPEQFIELWEVLLNKIEPVFSWEESLSCVTQLKYLWQLAVQDYLVDLSLIFVQCLLQSQLEKFNSIASFCDWFNQLDSQDSPLQLQAVCFIAKLRCLYIVDDLVDLLAHRAEFSIKFLFKLIIIGVALIKHRLPFFNG